MKIAKRNKAASKTRRDAIKAEEHKERIESFIKNLTVLTFAAIIVIIIFGILMIG